MPVELSRLNLSLSAETTVAENVSPRGARVVSKQRWKEGDRVLVKALTGDLQWPAQVVYCEILPNSAFAIGLKLLTAAGINARVRGDNNSTRKQRSKSQAPIIPFPRVRGALTRKGRLWYFAAAKCPSLVRLALHPKSGHLHKRKLLFLG